MINFNFKVHVVLIIWTEAFGGKKRVIVTRVPDRVSFASYRSRFVPFFILPGFLFRWLLHNRKGSATNMFAKPCIRIRMWTSFLSILLEIKKWRMICMYPECRKANFSKSNFRTTYFSSDFSRTQQLYISFLLTWPLTAW